MRNSGRDGGGIAMERGTARYLKTYFSFFIPIVTLSLVFSAAYYQEQKDHSSALLEKREKYIIEKQQALIEKKIFSIVSDLQLLASHHELSKAVNAPDKENLPALAHEFFQFCKYKTTFDQVRFIDLTGQEVVRINYNDGDPLTVPADQLQNKGKRYYFLDTIRLGENEIFISPYDLNIENGKIETPLKPMIRFGTPVFTQDKKKAGIIILNYFGTDLLNDLETELGKIMMVNAQGHWLKGMSPEDEWGFMIKEKSDKKIQNRFPDAWQQIKETDSGQFYTGDALFTFSTIKPLQAGLKSSLGSTEAYVSTGTPEVAPDDYYWKIIARISPGFLSGHTHKLLNNIGLMNGGLLLLLALGCCFVTRELQKRKEADLKLQQTKATLQSVFNSSIPICVTNFDYEIILANGEYIKTFKNAGLDQEGAPMRCYQSRPGPLCKTEACPLQRIAAGEKEVTFDETKTTDDKDNQHFIVTARPLYNAEGVPLGIVESFQDITARDKLGKERDRLIGELQEALKEVNTLSGLLPICAHCKKVRDDQGYWSQIESYISSHSEAEFSHGICPGCIKEFFPKQYESKKKKAGR